MSNITLIMKPTLACNADCKYCYFKDIRTQNKMSLEIFEKVINKLKSYNNISFIWHGGEPMLMGLNFFNGIIKLQKDSKLHIKNNIQTNLILLDKAWIEFFKKNCFGVSTSLDGIKEVHNIGRNNFDKVVNNIKELNRCNLKVGAVSVVSDYTLPYLYENFTLFSNLNLNVRINPQMCTPGNKDAITINTKSYEFAVRFYHDLWLGENNNNFRIEPTCEILDYINMGKHPGCVLGEKSCVGKFPAILSNGDVIHCGRFVGSDHGFLGNVCEPEFSFGLDNKRVLYYHNMDIERSIKCKDCKYFNLCHGGCFHNSLIPGNMGKDIFCEAYKNIFEHILTRQKQLGL